MDTEIRTLREGEFDAFQRANAASFHEEVDAAKLELERKILEPERVHVAVEGDQIVAGAAAAPFMLSVPGGEQVSCAGVTAVGTLPTHRRQGLARRLLELQLNDVHERGEALAYLWASEAAIYQRFGYGTGSYTGAFEIRSERSAFTRPVATSGRIRLVDRAEAFKLIPEVYERVRSTRPGMPDRSPAWLEDRFYQHSHGTNPPGALFFAVHESADGVEGYVAYSVKEGWHHDQGPDHQMDIDELMWTTSEAYAALWRYCFDVDLVRLVRGWKRPVDEPLLHMLTEPRALRFQIRDGTWLRVVDLAAALEGRRYSHEGRVRLEIRDATAAWNDGAWELEGGPDGATCRRTDAEPDLSMEIGDLAAAYLGAVSFRQLVAAGRVEERAPGSLSSADAMFSSATAPWCPWIF